MGAVSYESGSKNRQNLKADIKLRIITSPYSQSHSEAPELMRENALEVLDHETSLYESLSTFKTSYTNRPTRESLMPYFRADGLRMVEVGYVFNCSDRVSSPDYVQLSDIEPVVERGVL
jgi:hypothetical protein